MPKMSDEDNPMEQAGLQGDVSVNAEHEVPSEIYTVNEESNEAADVDEEAKPQVGPHPPEDLSSACLRVEHTVEALKPIIEAILFSANKPLSDKVIQRAISNVFVPELELVRQTLVSLVGDYKGRGVQLIEVSSGYRFQVPETVIPWVHQLQPEKPQRYSRSLLETLALIAYRQPITRGEIEDIRGVAVSSHIIRTLQERKWIRVVGHKEVPGRPALLATTGDFLDHFNLQSLQELPALTEVRNLDEFGENLESVASISAVEALETLGEAEDEDGDEGLNGEAEIADVLVAESGVVSDEVEPPIADEQMPVSFEALSAKFEGVNEVADVGDKVDVSEENFVDAAALAKLEDAEEEK